MLSVKKSVNGQQCTIEILGIMDYVTVEELDHSFEIPENIKTVILNLSELDFIDSTGIGSMLGLIYSAKEKSINVDFVGMSDETREVFETVGVFRIIEALRRKEF